MKLNQEGNIFTLWFDSGSLPPDYYYSCTIEVNKSEVRLTIKNTYQKIETVSETVEITEDQFQGFLHQLNGIGILKTAHENNISDLCGAPLYYFSVINNGTVQFDLSSDNNPKILKQIEEVFYGLLSDEMKESLEDPSQYYQMMIDQDEELPEIIDYNGEDSEIWNNDNSDVEFIGPDDEIL